MKRSQEILFSYRYQQAKWDLGWYLHLNLEGHLGWLQTENQVSHQGSGSLKILESACGCTWS